MVFYFIPEQMKLTVNLNIFCSVIRVRAENLYGLSEPLESKPVVAKSPFDTPEAPEPPKILSYTPTSASLQWAPPSNPGGMSY
jgi:hypothetical protein